MRRSLFLLAISCLIILSAGCATTAATTVQYPALSPVPPPTSSDMLKVDNLLVLADISRSMKCADKIGTEKALLASFNSGIPQGLKESGLRTFGKSAYHDTVLVQPLQQYDRGAFAQLIADLKAGCGNTPLTRGLVKAKGDLMEAQGNTAILVVSDGENLLGDPIPATLLLKKIYGDRLCIHTVHVGDCIAGAERLKQVATQSGCGIAVSAADLQTPGGMAKFITDVFYGRKVVDSDGDGVPDYLDKCPDTPKGVKVDKVGCPLDSDGDGVPDYLDKCPDTPKGAPVNSVGCWIIKGINFDTNKWNVNPQYHGVLDESVRVLKENPTIKVEIQGYTDSRGSEQSNQILSEKRANSVKDYFVSKGISADRLNARGFGEANPVATNDTAEGMAENRRIEIKIVSR